MGAGMHRELRRFGIIGRKIDNDRPAKVRQLLALAEHDRYYRWRSAMLQTWEAGDVLVGVSKGLEISLFTTKDCTDVPDPYELSEALIHADRYARAAAARTASRVLTA